MDSNETRFWIINDDALKTQAVEDGSIDLIVTSPPYNVGIGYGSNEDELAYADYLQFSKKWFSRCLGWLKPDGRFCLNIPLDINKGGQRHVGADLTKVGDRGRFSVPLHHRHGTRATSQNGRHGVHGCARRRRM